VEFHDYRSIDEAVRTHLEAGDDIICTDISPSTDVLEMAAADYPQQLAVYDHHAKGAWATFFPTSHLAGAFDPDVCGARLFYREFVKPGYPLRNPAVDLLLDQTEARDLWQTGSDHWEWGCLLTQLVKKMGIERCHEWLAPRVRDGGTPIVPFGMADVLRAMEAKQLETAEQIAEKANRARDEEGRIYYWVMAGGLASEIGHAICRMYEDAQYAHIFMPALYKSELRAEDKVDVGVIAKNRGGGGHPNASGYTLGFTELPGEMALLTSQSLMSHKR
jgi:oligoribonuclease NrnB/cAMP/cGMP phosphodiesterase (DHH superfamily)